MDSKDLLDHMRECKGKAFDLKTTIMVAKQMVRNIFLHALNRKHFNISVFPLLRSVIFKDFMIKVNKNASNLYLIDTYTKCIVRRIYP